MQDNNKLDILFQMFSNEQLMLQRTDQKAFTLLSIIGVFAVFFIIHYTKIPPDIYNLTLVFLYFVSVLISIYFLLLVIMPRLKSDEIQLEEDKKSVAPTYFGGVVKFKSAKEYSDGLKSILDNPDLSYEAFSRSIFSISMINSLKNKNFKKGIAFFILAITFELAIIISLYVRLALES